MSISNLTTLILRCCFWRVFFLVRTRKHPLKCKLFQEHTQRWFRMFGAYNYGASQPEECGIPLVILSLVATRSFFVFCSCHILQTSHFLTPFNGSKCVCSYHFIGNQHKNVVITSLAMNVRTMNRLRFFYVWKWLICVTASQSFECHLILLYPIRLMQIQMPEVISGEWKRWKIKSILLQITSGFCKLNWFSFI